MSASKKPIRSLHLVLLSDTHELHRELDVPDGDILIHAGDFTMFSRSMKQVADFDAWLGELPHRHKIVIPGNHEFFLEKDPLNRSLLRHGTVLINQGVEIAGLKLWGSPVTPLASGASGLSSDEDRRNLYAGIRDDTDVLITHPPPFGILDTAPGSGIHTGCPELARAVSRIRPKLHVFGHAHRARGVVTTDHTIRERGPREPARRLGWRSRPFQDHSRA